MTELHGPTHENGGGGVKGLTGKKLSLPLVGGIVVVGGILAFVMMRGGSSHAGASAGTGAQVNSGTVNANDAMALSEQMRGIQANSSNMFSDLAAKLAAGQTPTGTITNPPINSGDWVETPGFSGLSYQGKGPFTQGGYQYFHLDNPGLAESYGKSGGQSYYFPVAGVAAPNPGPGTNQYGRIPVPAGGYKASPLGSGGGHPLLLASGPTANA